MELEVKFKNRLKVASSGKEKRPSSFGALRWICPGVYRDRRATCPLLLPLAEVSKNGERSFSAARLHPVWV